MKILYIATERPAAELAASALRAAAPGLAIAWAPTLSAAQGWLAGNADIALLIIEVESDDPGYAAFVAHARRLGITAPLIIVTSDEAASLTSLKDVGGAIVTKDRSFPGALGSLVSRALKTVPQTAPRTVRVGYVGEAALARECFGKPGGPTELVETAPGPDGTYEPLPADLRSGEPLPFDVLLIEHGFSGVDTLAILKDITARRLHVPVVLVAEWVEDLAVLAHKLGIVDYVVKSKASFRALFFRLHHLLAQPAPRTLEPTLAEAEAASRRVQQRRLADAAAAAGKLLQQHAELTTRLDDAVRARDGLHERLIAAEAALEVVQRKLADTTTALDQARLDGEAFSAQALTQAASDARLAEEIGLRQAVETRLTDAVAALERAEQRHADEMREATARLEERDAKAVAELAEAVSAASELQNKLADATAALERAEARHADEMREAAARLREQDEKAATELAEAVSGASELQNKLGDTTAALERAEARHAGEMREAAARLEERNAKAAAELAEAVSAASELQNKLVDATAALERAEARHADEIREAAARLEERDAKAVAELAEAVSAASELRNKLVDATAALERAEAQARAAGEAASEAAAQRQAGFDAQLAAEACTREGLETKLADATAALERAERRHASEMHEATARLAEHQKATETRLAQAAAAFDAVQARLVEAAAQVQRAEQQAAADRQAAAEEAARQRVKFESELAEHVSRQQLLETRLADSELQLTHSAERARALQETLAEVAAELGHVRQQADVDRLAAQEQAIGQQAEFDRKLAQEAANREAIERALADEVAARHHADEQHASEIAAAAARLAESQRQAEAQLAQAAAEASASLQVAVEQAAAAQRTAAEQAAEREGALETELAQQAARREVLEAELADRRAAFEQAERRFADQVTAMRESAREHEARLEERAARERGDWEDTLAERQQRIHQLQTEGADLANERVRLEALVVDVERRLASTLEAQTRDRGEIAGLQKQVAALEARLDATRGERDRLKAQADRVPQLRRQIDDIRSERHRQFEEATIGLLRCNRDGVVTGVNRALAALLGYDSPETLQKIDFVSAVFESGSELPWIAGRLTSSSIEPVETTWKARDGRRLVVRLHVVPAAADSIEVAVEDNTAVRDLEEKLRLSQRRAAVARYASEAAIACDRLLEDIALDARRWLATIDNDAVRRQGQRLLDDITRAAGRLQQVATCISEEKKGFELVDVHKVLRHLQPTLKQIAGSRVEIVPPKATAPLNLDVETERIERILINVAAYGRERMPRGGRLTIEVASVVVDHTFVTQYPHVRTGPHVLLTITEKRGDPRPGLVPAVPERAADVDAARTASGTPGVDLGALQSLVSECGGHLWMATDPSGDLVLKIHLPRRALDRAEPHPAATRPILSRWVERLSGARP